MNIKKLTENATIPTRGSKQAAGWDLYGANTSTVLIPPHATVKIPTNIAMEIPDGYFGGIFPRSGISSKRGLRLANCVAVIDSDYRGDVIVPIHNDTNVVQMIEAHERIAQIVILPYLPVTMDEVDTLSNTERGEGGFGSTGTV